MYERMLVRTDGSERAGGALKHAFGFVTQHDAELHVVYVPGKSTHPITRVN